MEVKIKLEQKETNAGQHKYNSMKWYRFKWDEKSYKDLNIRTFISRYKKNSNQETSTKYT